MRTSLTGNQVAAPWGSSSVKMVSPVFCQPMVNCLPTVGAGNARVLDRDVKTGAAGQGRGKFYPQLLPFPAKVSARPRRR